MSKRRPEGQLNHDNWDNEDEPEEAGEFRKANDVDLKHRVIKMAKRRLPDQEPPSATKAVFSGFSGFSGFQFSKSTTNSPLWKVNANDSAAKTTEKKTKSDSGEDLTEYWSKVRLLNEDFLEWIKQHVQSDPSCILIPVFRSYETHIQELNLQYKIDNNNSNGTSDSNIDFRCQQPLLSLNNSQNSRRSSDSTSHSEKFMEEDSEISFRLPSENSMEGSRVEDKSINEENTKKVEIIQPKVSEKVEERPAQQPASLNLPKPGVFNQEASGPQFSFAFNFTKSTSETTTKAAATGLTTAGLTTSSTIPAISPMTFFGSSKAAESAAETTKSVFGASSFSFSGLSAKPLVAGASSGDGAQGDTEEPYEPPKPETVEIKEEGSFYSKRCKMYYKQDGQYVEKGIGFLHLKRINDKTQLVIRAETTLGNILLNIVLQPSIPIQRLGKRDVTLFCIPNPPLQPAKPSQELTAILLRVKNEEEADELSSTLNENKAK